MDKYHREELEVMTLGYTTCKWRKRLETNLSVIKEGSQFIPFSFQGGEKEARGRTVGLSYIRW